MRLEVSKGYEASCRDEAGTTALCRVSTWDSDILSSCEVKAEPAI